MSKYVLIKSGTVENVIVADQAFIDQVYSGNGYTCNQVSDSLYVSPGFYYSDSSYYEPSTTTLSGSLTSQLGSQVTFVATVQYCRSGSVSFMNPDTATAYSTVQLVENVATWQTSDLEAGLHRVQAVFNTSAGVYTSTSEILNHTVNS